MRKLISMNVRNIDENLKNRFSAYCIERGKTLSEEIQRLMHEELERRKLVIADDTDEAV